MWWREKMSQKMSNVNGVNASEWNMLQRRRRWWLHTEFTENRKMIRRWNLRVRDDRRQCQISSINDDIHSMTTAMSRKIDKLIVRLQESRSVRNCFVFEFSESSTWRCWWLRKLAVLQHFVIFTYDRTSECTDLDTAQWHLFTKKSRALLPPTSSACYANNSSSCSYLGWLSR